MLLANPVDLWFPKVDSNGLALPFVAGVYISLVRALTMA